MQVHIRQSGGGIDGLFDEGDYLSQITSVESFPPSPQRKRLKGACFYIYATTSEHYALKVRRRIKKTG